MKNMTKLEFKKLLTSLGACEDATEWAKGKDLKTVWETCERGDWLLWLIGNMIDKPNWPTRQQLVLAACACAETSLKYVPEGELRPKQAIAAARRWANGQSSIEEVQTAARAAAVEASRAARAAAWAAEATAVAAEAAWAAAEAAEATAFKGCADLVRREIKLEFV